MDIIEYVRTARETLEERPLNRVDSLVLSCLAYLWLPEEVPASCTPEGVALVSLTDLATRLSLTAPLSSYARYEQLLLAVAESPRFAGLVACHAAEESSREEVRQFAAVTFRIPDTLNYVAFRGTDNTLLGWKEDLSMAFLPTVPAQESARAYLERISEQLEGPIYVGGHSKGGNLAAYATLMAPAPVRDRIVRCYDHDGPDFLDETTQDPAWSGAYELVDKTMPGESLVGLLLGAHGERPTVVESTRVGIWQHDPFSWMVAGSDFAQVGALSYDAYRTGKRLNAWLLAMAPEERERFVDILCRVVRATGEVTFSGLAQSLADGSLALMLQRLDGLPEQDRAFFLEVLDELVTTLLLGPAPTQATTPSERTAAAAERIDDITARFDDALARLEHYAG